MEKRARRKFTAEYKAEVVRLVRDGGKTIGEVSRGYCQVGESRPNIVGLNDAPTSIPCGEIGLEALNLTVPPRAHRVRDRTDLPQLRRVADPCHSPMRRARATGGLRTESG